LIFCCTLPKSLLIVPACVPAAIQGLQLYPSTGTEISAAGGCAPSHRLALTKTDSMTCANRVRHRILITSRTETDSNDLQVLEIVL
jgi:hypothetical protein